MQDQSHRNSASSSHNNHAGSMVKGWEDILQLDWIHGHLASSGQVTEAQLQRIRAAGFGTVINISMTDAIAHLDHEDRICLELGLNYIHLPLLWDRPGAEIGVLIMDMLGHLVPHHPVWLHCADGHRVASLMYLYRHHIMGVDLVQAERHLYRIWHPDDTWRGFMFAVGLQLQARRASDELAQLL